MTADATDSPPRAGATDASARRARPRVAVQALVVCVLAVLVGCWISLWVVRPFWHDAFDLHVYRGAMVWWHAGRPLYTFDYGHTPYGFTYPPFAALCMLPMLLVSTGTAIVLTALASVVAVVVTTWWLLAPVLRRHGWPPVFSLAVAVLLVLALEPVRETLGYGQVNLFLAALVLADVLALQRGRRWAGVGIGLATAVKLTPGLFIVYLALTRRWRAAGVAAGTFAAVSLLALAVTPGTSVEFWTSTLWDTGRVGPLDYTENQSLLGVLARLAAPGDPDRKLWAALVAVVLVLGLWRAVRAFRAGDELVGITLTGLTGNLISPISWTHHLYWVVPALVVLLDVAAGTPAHGPLWLRARPRATAGLAAVTGLVVAVPFLLSLPWFWKDAVLDRHAHGIAVLGENSFVLLLLLLVALLPARAPAGDRPVEPAR